MKGDIERMKMRQKELTEKMLYGFLVLDIGVGESIVCIYLDEVCVS